MIKTTLNKKRTWLGHYMRRDSLPTSAMEATVDGKRQRGRKRFQLMDNIKIEGTYLRKRCADGR